jgi:hypothetical protein
MLNVELRRDASLSHSGADVGTVVIVDDQTGLEIPVQPEVYQTGGFGWGYDGHGAAYTADAIADWVGIPLKGETYNQLVGKLRGLERGPESQSFSLADLREEFNVRGPGRLLYEAEAAKRDGSPEADLATRFKGPDGANWQLHLTSDGSIYARDWDARRNGGPEKPLVYFGHDTMLANSSHEERYNTWSKESQRIDDNLRSVSGTSVSFSEIADKLGPNITLELDDPSRPKLSALDESPAEQGLEPSDHSYDLTL